jgi:hypothetical protein
MLPPSINNPARMAAIAVMIPMTLLLSIDVYVSIVLRLQKREKLAAVRAIVVVTARVGWSAFVPDVGSSAAPGAGDVGGRGGA